MKRIVLIIATITSFNANCQEIHGKEDKIETPSKLLFGINLSPDLGNMKYDSKNEVMEIGFTSGITLRKNISNKWSIEGGILYSRKKYGYKTGELMFGDVIEPMNGIYNANSTTLNRTECSYIDDYIDLPIRTIKYFGSKRLRFFAGFGITGNILMKSQAKCTLENNNSVTQTIDLKRKDLDLNISTNISIGGEYKINNTFKIQIEPIYRQGLFNISNSAAKIRYWNVGANFTLYVTLK
jgi:hypothetical protein